MTHSCEWCSGREAVRVHRRAVLQFIRLHPNMSTSEVARQMDVTRPTVSNWRNKAERLGCVPDRTRDGRTWRRYRQLLQPTSDNLRGFPIGATWCHEDRSEK